MKIIGGHDYYDGAGYGVDETICFVRKKQMRLGEVETVRDHPFSHARPWSINWPERGYRGSLRPFIVIVAGKIYPGLQEHRIHDGFSGHRPDQCIFHYDLDAAIETFDMHVDYMRNFYFSRELGIDGKSDRKERLKEHFRMQISKDQMSWLIDNKVTVLSSYVDPYDQHDAVQLHINHACLKDLDFYKALDPFTTHMEIQGWISGVLPFNQNIVEISDTHRIKKAGFDLKTSFRRAPGKKRRSG